MTADEHGTKRFVGGLQRGYLHATGRLGELVIEDSGICIRLRWVPRAIFGFLAPTTVMSWESIRQVRVLHWYGLAKLVGGLSFVFVQAGVEEEVLFFCRRRTTEALIHELAKHDIHLHGIKKIWLRRRGNLRDGR